MKIIVGCEYSQVVTIAFRKVGHEAYSCDLLPAEGGHPEWHFQESILSVIKREKFDLGIFHPPCTRLCNSGVLRLYKDGKKGNGIDRVKWEEMIKGALFFKTLLDADIEKTVMENPVPHKYAMKIIGKKYSQIIQPYNFGEDASKATCLWIKGLPLLKNTSYFPPRIVNGKKRWGNQTDGGQNKLPPSADRGKIRAKTYEGIARAMVEQWGKEIIIGQQQLRLAI
jgi:hypothetical protein